MKKQENIIESGYDLLTSLKSELATRKLIEFTKATMPNYQVNWHHEFIANKLDLIAEKKIKKSMFFVPPQHGKSELASRRFPAFMFGKYPNLRIASCSYSSTFSAKFNRQVQRIIDSPSYANIFPETKLNKTRTLTDTRGNYLRNSSEFEIVNHSGSYISVGVQAGITGNSVDILIIDDPIKGRLQANSKTYRDGLWEWYTDEARTRLHNDSQQLIIMTRWHYDDLAGRILQQEADEWTVINIEAIKETLVEGDPRDYGDVLWESKHSLERMLKIKNNYPKTFYSLYQGKPTPDGGNKIKEEYFEIVNESEVPNNIKWEIDIDGAYTKKTTNDPTGIMISGRYKNTVYIKNSISKYLEMPELLKFIDSFTIANEFYKNNRIFVEPKASGITIVQLLNEKGYNAFKTKHEYVNVSKEERVDAILPFCESFKVKLIKGDWNSPFLEQLKRFPNGEHDEHVDCLCYSLIRNLLLKENTVKKITKLSELGL